MAQCNVSDLMSRASGFMGLEAGQRQAVITELLCRIKGGSCTAQALMDDAKNFAGLSSGQLAAVQTQLMCNWKG